MFTLVKDDDVLLFRYKTLGKSLKFFDCINSVLNHNLQWREFHSTMLTFQILILLSFQATAEELSNTLLSLEHTCETIDHRWNHRLKDDFKLRIVF